MEYRILMNMSEALEAAKVSVGLHWRVKLGNAASAAESIVQFQ